ncbi:protein AATF-like [Eriocheir sinensis]|uniref:protein AATF-like n=1 Tax=Eriocheir sinensis TaxID=95602 RepID=UPI0021C64267|nr:protein AATF-like [Eriocheir sinensis]
MSSALKTYVEKYLLNPGASFNVDDEGNQETKAQIVDSLLDEEKADSQKQSLSKLRARRAALETEKDPRYSGKKVLRKDLKKDREVEYDPELSKFCVLEGSEEEEEDDADVEEEDADEEEEDEESDEEDQSIDKKLSQNFKKLGTHKSNEESDEDEDEESSDENEGRKLYQGPQKKQKGVTFIDDGDFSKFADDMDDDDDEDADEEIEEEEEEDNDYSMETEDRHRESTLKKFRQEDMSEEVKKGQAVKNQLAIYDSLFEGRICMQKVLSATNQLPQHDTYKLFLKEHDQNYIKNLSAAKAASKNLLNSLLQIQELLLRQHPETNYIVTGKTPKDTGSGSDEEITSSEDEEEKPVENKETEGFRGLKRKMKVEEYEEVLSKRHAAVLPFRDQTINKWYEKTKLLSSRIARNNRFSSFETSALQQLQNILTNKDQLIRRTQLTGTTRGTTYHVLGRCKKDAKVESEEYDPEIFDDTDFYTRALEEVLKAKVSLSDNMTDVSRKWIEIQNLRRKAKKKVDKKASKGRKIRYEVMSKLQQYMAPSHGPQMDDAAINTLFASLFGKAIQKQRGPKSE